MLRLHSSVDYASWDGGNRRYAARRDIHVLRAARSGFANEGDDTTMAQRLTPERARAYWQRNLSLVARLLVIWFAVSFGGGILFVDELNAVRLGGYRLGFWFAQQGSIYVFVVLIFVYRWRMNALDREFGVAED